MTNERTGRARLRAFEGPAYMVGDGRPSRDDHARYDAMFDAIASDLDALAAAREAAVKLRSTVSVMRYEWGQNEHTRALEELLAALDGKREGM